MSLKVTLKVNYQLICQASSKKDADASFKPVIKQCSDLASAFGLDYLVHDFGYRPGNDGIMFMKEYSSTVTFSVVNSKAAYVLDISRTIHLFSDINGLVYLNEEFDFVEADD